MKFDETLSSKLSGAIDILMRIRKLSNTCGKILSDLIKEDVHRGEPFCETALQFNRINYEATDCILNSLRMGYVSESIVQLRWLLEMCHLFYFLSKNKKAYEDWLAGEEIRPREIGRFFEKEGLASWKESYHDWSNVAHGNHIFVENAHFLSKMTPTNDDQILLLSQTLRNLMFISHKFAYVLGPLFKGLLTTPAYNEITGEYNYLEKLIVDFSDQHNKNETRRLKQK